MCNSDTCKNYGGIASEGTVYVWKSGSYSLSTGKATALFNIYTKTKNTTTYYEYYDDDGNGNIYVSIYNPAPNTCRICGTGFPYAPNSGLRVDEYFLSVT